MSLYVLKLKTENKNITQDYMIGTGKNVKVVYKLKKINNQNKNSLFLFEVSVSFSISTTFYNILLQYHKHGLLLNLQQLKA